MTWNWLITFLGIHNEAGPEYAFWSGFGGSIPDVLIITAIIGWWWHHQCGVHRCFWPARRLTAAGERACFRHHPEPRRTVHDLHRAHHEAKAQR